MTFADSRQRARLMAALIVLHITIIAASNYLVQFPVTLFGITTTWGTFSYPFVYLATDLTVRLFGASLARRIVFFVLFPALAVSYVFSVLFQGGGFAGWGALLVPDSVALRIVLASFSAYFVGQLLDIFVFRRLLRLKAWWVAPGASTVFGNGADTLVFYVVAFAGSSNAFMAAHWPEIALSDYVFKVAVCVGLFVPLYGMFLSWLQKHLLLVTRDDGSPVPAPSRVR